MFRHLQVNPANNPWRFRVKDDRMCVIVQQQQISHNNAQKLDELFKMDQNWLTETDINLSWIILHAVKTVDISLWKLGENVSVMVSQAEQRLRKSWWKGTYWNTELSAKVLAYCTLISLLPYFLQLHRKYFILKVNISFTHFIPENPRVWRRIGRATPGPKETPPKAPTITMQQADSTNLFSLFFPHKK